MATPSYKVIAYKDFSGGWNADSAPDMLADNECEVFDNIDTSISGALKQRGGCIPLNETAYAHDLSEILEWNRKDGTTIYLGMMGNHLCTFDPDNHWVATSIVELDAPDIGYFFFQDKFYFTGLDEGFNGFWTLGGIQQVETLTVVGTVSGTGHIDVEVSSTLIGSGPPSFSISAGAGDTASHLAADIRSVLSGNDRITDHYVISGTGANVVLTAISPAANDTALNMALTIDTITGITPVANSTNTTAGSALSLVAVSPYSDATNDLNPIKKCRSFVWNPVNFRVFATGNPDDVQAIYYSEANLPNFFKSTNKVYPTRGEGACIGLSNFSTGIVVEYENAIWAWTGNDPATDATWGRLPIVHGALSHGSVCSTPNSLTMVGIGGLYALNPGALDKDLMMINASQMSTNLSLNKVNSVINSASHVSTMISCYDNVKQRYLLAYGDDSSNPKNNKILVYDFARNCFARFTGIQVDGFCSCSDGRVLVASGTWLLQLDVGVNDWDISLGEEKAIATWVRTKGWDFELPFIIKKIKKTFVAAYQYPTSGTTIDIGVIGGYRSQVFNIVPSIVYEDASIPDSFIWGDDWGTVWGWADLITREFRTRMKASRFAIDIKHAVIDEDMLIYGFAFMYRPKKAKGVRYHGTPLKDVLS